MFDVMIRIEFLKSMLRPKLSVSRPSSMIWRSMLKTSLCAFSISSKSTTDVAAAADLLGQVAAFLVADVSGRRADQARHVVLLHVLGHVDRDERVLLAEHDFGERLGASASCRRPWVRGR